MCKALKDAFMTRRGKPVRTCTELGVLMCDGDDKTNAEYTICVCVCVCCKLD